jgi:5-oxoprolinase (ATP-hydrolysing)
VVEKRNQAIVRRYATNHGSGGHEEFNGGSGCTREFEARAFLKVSVLSDRRVFPPQGMHGGEPGSVGRNILFEWNDDHTGKEMINLGGKAETSLEPG